MLYSVLTLCCFCWIVLVRINVNHRISKTGPLSKFFTQGKLSTFCVNTFILVCMNRKFYNFGLKPIRQVYVIKQLDSVYTRMMHYCNWMTDYFNVSILSSIIFIYVFAFNIHVLQICIPYIFHLCKVSIREPIFREMRCLNKFGDSLRKRPTDWIFLFFYSGHSINFAGLLSEIYSQKKKKMAVRCRRYILEKRRESYNYLSCTWLSVAVWKS